MTSPFGYSDCFYKKGISSGAKKRRKDALLALAGQ
jgi:hypothetical protein